MFEWFSNIQWEYLYDFELAVDSLPFLMEGLKITVIIASFSMFFSLVLGILLGVAACQSFGFFAYRLGYTSLLCAERHYSSLFSFSIMGFRSLVLNSQAPSLPESSGSA